MFNVASLKELLEHIGSVGDISWLPSGFSKFDDMPVLPSIMSSKIMRLLSAKHAAQMNPMPSLAPLKVKLMQRVVAIFIMGMKITSDVDML